MDFQPRDNFQEAARRRMIQQRSNMAATLAALNETSANDVTNLAPQGGVRIVPSGGRYENAQAEIAVTAPPKTVTFDAHAPTEFGASGISMSSGRAALSIAPPNWLEEREAWQRKIEAIETAIGVLAPIVQQLEKAEIDRHGIGGNYPPHETMPLDSAGVQMAGAAVSALRVELDQEVPHSWEAVRLAGLAIAHAEKGVGALLTYLGQKGDAFVDALVKSVGDKLGKRLVSSATLLLVLKQLHIDLGGLWSLIEHVLRLLDKL